MRRSRKGFTLAELLIVIAIIGILAAIAIPVFTSQLNNSRKAVDEANTRTAMSLATTEYLVNGSTGYHYYTFAIQNDMLVLAVDVDGNKQSRPDKAAQGFNEYVPDPSEEPDSSRKSRHSAGLMVTVLDGEVTNVVWMSA